MTLLQWQDKFSDEEACRPFLFDQRWPEVQGHEALDRAQIGADRPGVRMCGVWSSSVGDRGDDLSAHQGSLARVVLGDFYDCGR